MSVAEGVRRHPLLAGAVAFYVVDWLAYRLIAFGTSGIAVWEATRSWLPSAPGHRLGVALVCLLGPGVGATLVAARA